MAGRNSKYETHIKGKLDEVDKLLNDGASEKQVAEYLGVSYASFNNYKNQHKELADICNKPRTKLVDELRSALVKRAMGFTYEEKKQYIKEDDNGNKYKYTEITTKYQPPDTTAIFGALNIYDKDYVKDKKNYELKQQELELRKQMAEFKEF